VDERWVRVIVTAAIWLAVLMILRRLLRHAYDVWERRQLDTDPAVMARRRTTFSFLSRVIFTFVGAIGVWSVLSIFPQTQEIANALLASSAVLAVIAGLALSTPLGNLGAGVLVSFTQPIRLGDRVTIGDQTGFVEQINIIYTTLVTDDARRVFVPNTQLTTNAIVNRTIRDPRRTVSARIPVALDAPMSRVRDVVQAAVAGLDGTRSAEARVLIGEVGEKVVWLDVIAYGPLDADVASLGSDLRETVLTTLGREGFLPA
jgi:small-conductance mechanosensitive channel